MSSVFYAAFGSCRRRGFAKKYCYDEALKAVKKPSRRRKGSRRPAPKASGMARKGSHCRKKTRVWSPALGKKVLRCTGGYTRGSRR